MDAVTRVDWARLFWRQHAWKRNLLTTVPRADTLQGLLAWIGAEHGPLDPHPAASWNPLNTTLFRPGATPFNTLDDRRTHVWNYRTLADGMDANLATLHNGLYAAVIEALEHGSATTIARAIEQSVWGTRNVSGVLRYVSPDSSYYTAIVGSGPAISPPQSVPPDGMPTLRMGDRGGAVVYAQELLASHRFLPPNSTTKAGDWDGIFGPGTHSAVMLFQHSCSLPTDGVIGPRTWIALAEHPDPI